MHLRVVLLCLFAGTQDGSAATPPSGAWRESKCMVRGSGCTDEDSLYRFAPVEKAPDSVRLSGNKVINGREINMGDIECRYDSRAGAIDCPLPNGSAIHLEVNGSSMEGRMTLRDGTFWRRISLRKVEVR